MIRLPGGATFKKELNEEEQIKKELENFQSKVGAPANVNYQSATCPIDPATLTIKELNTKKCSVAANRHGFHYLPRTRNEHRFGREITGPEYHAKYVVFFIKILRFFLLPGG